MSLLWCTEALPLFVTSMLVPLLTVLLRVLVDASDPQHPHRLTPKQAAPRIFHAMFSQVTPHTHTVTLHSGRREQPHCLPAKVGAWRRAGQPQRPQG